MLTFRSRSRFPRGYRNGLKYPHVDIRHLPFNLNAQLIDLDLDLTASQLGRRRNRGWRHRFPPRCGFDYRGHSMVPHPASARPLCAINRIFESPWERKRPLAATALPSNHRNAKTLRQYFILSFFHTSDVRRRFN
jgi:hypothetical protein